MRSVTAFSSMAVGIWMSVAAGCIGWTTPLFERQVQVRAAPPAPGPLDVETDNGSIDVSRAEGAEVVVDATVKARTQERADATIVAAEPSPDGVLTIRVRWPEGGRKNNEGCDLRISVPGVERVRAQTSNGGIRLADLSGAADLDTSNGEIVVRRHAGPVRIETSNGGIVLEGVAGEVDAATSNGGIRIELAAEAAGPVRAQTSNGTIRLRVGPAFAGRLRASTSNGGVRIEGGATLGEVGKGRADVTFGEGGAESTLRTSNGDIEVSRGP